MPLMKCNTIRKDMYAEDQTIFTQSKVLFAMSLMEQPKEEMSAVMKELANGKTGFYKDCADTLDSMDKDEFRFLMQEFMDSYAVHAMEYRIPHISRAEVPLDSRLMKIEESANIKAPYVISVTDPFNRNKRFAGALRLLTPREHLRLMGFTDRDYNHMILSGIEAKQVSFLAGNSICIPVLEALYHSLEELDLLL